MSDTLLDHHGGPLAISIIDARQPWQVDRLGDQTIVFHHGLGACGAIWRSWMPALMARYRLVTFDMRGHGKSPAPPGFHWSIDGMVSDILAVVSVAGAERFHLVGESIGGTAALAFAVRYPDRLHSLTISNGTHKGGTIENLAPWKKIIDAGGMAAWSKHMMGQRFYEGALRPHAYEWYERQQATAKPDALLEAAEMLAGADLEPDLAQAIMPTLLLHPDNSPFIPVSAMTELHELLPDARLQIFANTRHGLPYSHARACSRSLRRFLRDVEHSEKQH